ncbi:MAG: type IV pilus assembly protein PilM, partial [Phycisphaerae bacterium]|nr:type IV pilus assembly protein PilM [Phycisphaerae bacterium]
MAGKSKLAWGIDVGQYGLRAIRLEAVGSDLLVSDFEIINYPHSLADLPAASHDQTIREALSKFTSRHNLKGAAVVVGVPGRNSQARFVALPPVEAKKIPQIVEFEARQQIPFDINDVVWDYQPIKLQDSPDVIAGIFFIKRDVVESFLANFQQAGISTDQVQMSPMALYNAMVYDGLTDPQAATAILDVGSANSEFIVADGQKVFHRTIPIGGNNFTQALAKTFKLSFSKAENLKRKCATSKYAKQVFQAMRSVFSDLSAEVQRSIGFYTTLNRQASIARMLAVGNTFHLPGLQKYLQQSLKIELIRIDQFSRLSLAPQLSAAAFSAGVLSMGVAYGLALQGLGRANIKANLLPPAIARRQLWRAKKPIFVAAVALLALIVGSIYARNLMDLSVLNGLFNNQKPDAAPRIVKQAQTYRRELRQADDQVKKERQSIDDYVVLRAERDVWPAMVRAMTGVLNTAEDPAKPAAEYDKERSKRRLIFLQNFSSKYS